jgi:uncharacterized protein (DUF697 family)
LTADQTVRNLTVPRTVSTRRSRIPNPISNVREVLSIVRELSLDALRYSAMTEPRIAIIGHSLAEAREAAEWIFGPEARRLVVAQAEHERWPRGADIVLVDRRARPQKDARGETVIEFSTGESVERIRQAMFRGVGDIELSLGRFFPALRQDAAMYVVNSTSRVNAQFAVASNLPALVPVVGGVLAAGADTIILTKNQLMMIYKLAAIHGHDLDNRMRIYREMIPVVGAGLFWRTVARQLAAMIPFAAGTVPKVAIAFAGTYAAGMAAHIYYCEGERASAERMRAFYQEALEKLPEKITQLPALAGKRLAGDDAADPHVVDVDYRSGTTAETA